MSRQNPTNFFIRGLESEVHASSVLSLEIQGDGPITDGVKATIEVPYANFDNVFQFGLESNYDDDDISSNLSRLAFQTNSKNGLTKYWLGGDPSDSDKSSIDLTTATIDDNFDTFGSVGDDTQTIGQHFIKLIADQLFGTYRGDILFTNQSQFQTTLNNDINSRLKVVIQNCSVFFEPADTISQSNLAGKVFANLVQGDPSFLYNIDTVQVGTYTDPGSGKDFSMYKIPFMAGDKIFFSLQLDANPDQNKIIDSAASTNFSANTKYTVCLKLV
jgi:hypothetical protein